MTAPSTDMQARVWFVAMLARPTPQQRAEFRAWLADPAHLAAYDAVRRGWDASGQIGAELAGSDAAALETYLRAMDGPRRRARRLPAAVMVLLLVAGGLWLEKPDLWQNLGADHATARAERRLIHLQDGSSVELDADSAIAVDFTATQRRVRLLRGAGFFDVTHTGTPFVVDTEAGQVRVLGTRFDLRVDDDGSTVTLERGQVAVTTPQAPAPVLLQPGQQVRFDDTGAGAVEEVALTDASAWREGRYVFYGAPLSEVLGQIGRYRKGRIVIANPWLADLRVTGSLVLADSDAALAALQSSVGFRMHSVAGRLTIVGP